MGIPTLRPPTSTHRPGQVAAHPLPLHQLQADVDVELPAVLDVLVAAQRVLAAGGHTTRSAPGPSPSHETPQNSTRDAPSPLPTARGWGSAAATSPAKRTLVAPGRSR